MLPTINKKYNDRKSLLSGYRIQLVVYKMQNAGYGLNRFSAFKIKVKANILGLPAPLLINISYR
jgi:hypothetical protein